MISIIRPDQFKTIPWKNGQGTTTELAISPNGTLDRFNWRLSIASVVENGPFSNFSGYDRQLILLTGNGIKLTHDEQRVDELKAPLSMATFDGGSHTVGTLLKGPIKDFNVMTKQHAFRAEVKTFTEQQTVTCSSSSLNFVYATSHIIEVSMNQEKIELLTNHLLQISDETNSEFHVSGQGYIVISLFVL